ncbi:MAG TPA: hypothetical protein VFY71_15850, partial [Planctomycetota bacterium]|nr:hypothetical protein [Planctomycetota bacterium]
PDIVGFVLPGLVRARELLAAGGTGAWDDAQMLGFPFAASQHFPLPSHVDWLAAPFEPVQALDVLLAVHVAAALWLAYRAARLLGAAPPFAALAAVGFTFSAWMTTRWHCPPMTWATTWFPLQLAALAWLRQRRPARALFESGVGTALGLMSGFPQAPFLLGMATVALALGARETRRPRALLVLAAAGVLGACVALPCLLGALQQDGASLRSRPESRAALAGSHVPAAALADLLLPDFFGDAVAFGGDTPPAPTMEQWLPDRLLLSGQLQGNAVEVAAYVGVLGLLLLPAALSRGAGREARVLALVAVAALVGAVVAARVATAVPGLDRLAFSNTKRLLCVWCCVLPFAAALAAQAVAERRARWPGITAGVLLAALLATPWLAGHIDDPQAGAFAADLAREVPWQAVMLIAGALALRLARRGALWAWAPALLLTLDLTGRARQLNPTVPDEPLLPATRTMAALEPLAASSTLAEGRTPRGRVAVFGSKAGLLPPTLVSAAGVRDLRGITAFVPERTADLLACLEGPLWDPADPRVGRGLTQPASLSHPLLDLLGVTAVAHADPALAQETGLPVLLEAPEEGVALLARPSAGPPAFVCSGARLMPDGPERLAWLARRDAPVFETVLLERAPPFALPERGPRSDAQVERAGPEAITVRCDAPAPGVLVVSEAWDPGWSLRLDGQQAPVECVDHALLGAFVGAGPHVLELRYATPGAGGARAAAVVALLLLGAAGALACRRPVGP